MSPDTQRLLRRMALAGRWDDVRACLNACIQDDPQDIEAKEELRRLDNNIPMRLTLSAAERRKAAVKDAQKALEWLIDDTPCEQLRLLNKEELNTIQSAFTKHSDVLKKHGIALSATETEYRKTLKYRLREFSGRMTKRVLVRTGIAAGLVAALGGIWYTLNLNAHARHAELLKAIESPVYENLPASIRRADGGFNRFFCPEISDTIRTAERWLRTAEKQYNAIDSQLSLLETGKKKISALSPTEIAQIEADIEATHRGHEQLLKRWQELCLRQYNELVTHKAKIQQELEHPIPILPEMTGDWAADIHRLTEYKDRLSQRLTATKATVRLYGISTEVPAAIQHAIDSAQQLQKEIKQLRHALNKLSACKSYATYQKALSEFTPSLYYPAKKLQTIKQLLPSEEDINLQVAAPGGDITGELLAAAADIYLKGKPSFSAKFPPTQEVLLIPEDLFTAPSYQYKVYTLKISDRETWYSTIQPQLDKTNFITYRRSSIDPAFTPEDTYREFQNDDSFELGEIDATKLLIDLQIDRNTFFIRKNLPILLTEVLNYPEGKHPALAQAYIYWVLLKLTNAHPYPLLSGVRFAPTLKTHSASFVDVMKRQRVNLKPGCWLSNSADVRRANQAFAEWFRTHRGQDYPAEMAGNFRCAYSATARFCGYVNENGRMQLCRALQNDEPFWYVSAAGVKQATVTAPPQDAVLLTPIFTAERPKP